MEPRTERILAWLTIVVSLAVVAVAFVEIDRRSDETDQAIAPTAVPSPTSAITPTPGATESPALTEPISPPVTTGAAAATAAASPTATAAPPATPSPTPVPAVQPTPVVPQGSPVPVTGGGATMPGLTLVLFSLALGIVARRSY